jgi:hypothetical protein
MRRRGRSAAPRRSHFFSALTRWCSNPSPGWYCSVQGVHCAAYHARPGVARPSKVPCSECTAAARLACLLSNVALNGLQSGALPMLGAGLGGQQGLEFVVHDRWRAHLGTCSCQISMAAHVPGCHGGKAWAKLPGSSDAGSAAAGGAPTKHAAAVRVNPLHTHLRCRLHLRRWGCERHTIVGEGDGAAVVGCNTGSVTVPAAPPTQLIGGRFRTKRPAARPEGQSCQATRLSAMHSVRAPDPGACVCCLGAHACGN